jgi:uncharacterized protein YacL
VTGEELVAAINEAQEILGEQHGRIRVVYVSQEQHQALFEYLQSGTGVVLMNANDHAGQNIQLDGIEVRIAP